MFKLKPVFKCRRRVRLQVGLMKMMYALALVTVLLAGSAFAQSCTSSADCGDSEYCDGYGTCQPYFTSTTTTSGCCAPAAMLGLVTIGAVALSRKN